MLHQGNSLLCSSSSDEHRITQSAPLLGELGIERLVVVDPRHQDGAEGVEIDDEVESAESTSSIVSPGVPSRKVWQSGISRCRARVD